MNRLITIIPMKMIENGYLKGIPDFQTPKCLSSSVLATRTLDRTDGAPAHCNVLRDLRKELRWNLGEASFHLVSPFPWKPYIALHRLIWEFPKIGVPPNHPF